jgi:hypothetical protein
MPRADRDINVVVGLREHLIAKARRQVGRLEDADSDLYDFTTDLTWQRKRLADLEADADVLVYRYEIPREVQPPRNGVHIFTLRGDKLMPAERERVSLAFREATD